MTKHRKVLCYVRRTSIDDIAGDHRCNTSGPIHSAGLRACEETIEHIEDLVQGSGSWVQRPQYQYMLSEITAGRVDIVTVADASRISRDAHEFMRFIALCAAHDVRLLIAGTLVDARQSLDRLTIGVMAICLQYENRRRGGSNEEEG